MLKAEWMDKAALPGHRQRGANQLVLTRSHKPGHARCREAQARFIFFEKRSGQQVDGQPGSRLGRAMKLKPASSSWRCPAVSHTGSLSINSTPEGPGSSHHSTYKNSTISYQIRASGLL